MGARLRVLSRAGARVLLIAGARACVDNRVRVAPVHASCACWTTACVRPRFVYRAYVVHELLSFSAALPY